MTWLSINPDSEPFSKKSAVIALSSSPADSWADIAERMESPFSVNPTRLAELYNNVEALGLDLYSLGRKCSDG